MFPAAIVSTGAILRTLDRSGDDIGDRRQRPGRIDRDRARAIFDRIAPRTIAGCGETAGVGQDDRHRQRDRLASIVGERVVRQRERIAAEGIDARSAGRSDRRIANDRRTAIKHRTAESVIAQRDVIEDRRERVDGNPAALVIAVSAVLDRRVRDIALRTAGGRAEPQPLPDPPTARRLT